MRGDSERAPVVVEVVINDHQPAPQFRGLALAREMFGLAPGPLEDSDSVAIVGRCTECLDLMCGYTDTYVRREAEGVLWEMRSVWYEPQVDVESEHLNWQMKFLARLVFDTAVYDEEVARAREDYQALLRTL